MTFTIRPVTAWSDIPPIVSLEEARAHLNLEAGEGDDGLIQALARAAQDHVEKHSGHVLTPRTMEMVTDRFPAAAVALTIPVEPVSDVLAVTYEGDGGLEASIPDYRWVPSQPGQVRPAWLGAWPYGSNVRVEFEAGYAEGAAPPSLVAAVKLMLGDLYTRREDTIVGASVAELPRGVAALCAPYRRRVL